MIQLEELKNKLCRYLTGRLDAAVVGEYPAAHRTGPPAKTVVGIGIAQVKAVGTGISSYLGRDGQGEDLRGRRLEVVLRFDILAPAGEPGCHALFTKLCEALLLEEAPVPVDELWCGELSYDRSALGLRMTANARVTALLSKNEEAGEIREIQLVRREA